MSTTPEKQYYCRMLASHVDYVMQTMRETANKLQELVQQVIRQSQAWLEMRLERKIEISPSAPVTVREYKQVQMREGHQEDLTLWPRTTRERRKLKLKFKSYIYMVFGGHVLKFEIKSN